MKYIAIFSLFAAQLACVPASNAASLHEPHHVGRDAQSQTGTFAGARFRMAFGGKKKERARAGLTFAPLRSGLSSRGMNFTQIGEGVELGFNNRAKGAQLTIAGQNLTSARLGPENERKHGRGLRTAAYITGGVLVVGVIVGVLLLDAHNDSQSE